VALAIDASSPALTTQTNTATAALATGSFTPPAGSVLLIQWVSDGGATPGSPTITDNLGTPLTYTLLDWKAANSGTPAAGGQAASWRAVVGSSSAMIVTVTNGAVSGERAAALKVTVLTGADTTTPIGAHNKSGSLSAASIAQTYTATSTGGQGFIVVCDFNQLGNETAGTGCTVVSTGSVLTNISYGFLRRTSADDVATVSNSLNVTIPGTSTNLSWTYAEVLPAATSTATFPPNRTIRRRLATAPRLPRGSARISTPVRAQVNPPFPFNSVHQPRRLRALSPRRGETAMPVPAQVVVAAPTFPPSLIRPRLKGLRMFRADAVMPVPTQAAAVAPTYPPQTLRSRVRGLRLFRPRAAVHVPGQGHPPVAPQPPRFRLCGLRVRGRLALPPATDQFTPTSQRPRLRLPRLARGRTVNPTLAQVAVTPPAYPPQSVRTRLRGLRLARGRVAAPVPAQIVVTPPAYPPLPVRTRLRGLRLFRGRAAAPVPPQVAVAPAVFVPLAVRARIRGLRLFRGRAAAPVLGHPASGTHAPRARPHTPAPRRGHATMPVPAQVVVAPPVYPPRSVRSRLKGLRSARGHQAAMPVPPQIVIVPPKIVPLFSRIKQHAARLFRGGQVRTPVVAICDCETHRPNLGTTARPGMGMTARPSSGITARPGSGVTARPDTGTTSRPCTCGGG
jgi:hypothetical protein